MAASGAYSSLALRDTPFTWGAKILYAHFRPQTSRKEACRSSHHASYSATSHPMTWKLFTPLTLIQSCHAIAVEAGSLQKILKPSFTEPSIGCAVSHVLSMRLLSFSGSRPNGWGRWPHHHAT